MESDSVAEEPVTHLPRYSIYKGKRIQQTAITSFLSILQAFWKIFGVTNVYFVAFEKFGDFEINT